MIGFKIDQSSLSRKMIPPLFLMCLITMGCALIKAKADIDKSLENTVVVGRVLASSSGNGPIIVAARAMDEGNPVFHYTVLHESGEYELMVAPGRYQIFAYRDENSNLIYDAGEPAGHYGDQGSLRVPAVGVVFDIDIVIPHRGETTAIPHGTIISSSRPNKLYSRQAGDITDLDDERFSEKNGIKGFWEPMSFFRQFGGNIYFLEEYDPEKIPILFIHGAAGTPRGWRNFVEHIDRTRFQPWFFYYPSGARIDSMSYLLLWKLINLQTKYRFNRLFITAHSMGGLVARSFIVNYGRQFPCVKLFVSLATPWGGDRMAEYGVQQSPVVIPSWIDMQPEGDFIKSLYRMKMPESVRFYMFCGHSGNRNPFQSNNDGTITLSSILDYRAQSEAQMNYVFNEDHTSILFSQAILDQYNAILDEYDEKAGASRNRSGGYVRIHFSFDDEFDGVRPAHTFDLHPIGKKDGYTVIHLRDEDNGKVFGPFPSGDYVASMITPAARPKKNNIPVSIQSHTTADVNFVFMPDGVIRGCVAADLSAEEKSIGMPDYRYRSADRKVKIESIVLKGSGLYRKLGPMEDKDIDYDDFLNNNYLVSRDDFCVDTCFGFFGLPTGHYKLIIKANGYQPVEKNYSVTPGILQYFRITELTPTSRRE